MLRRLRELGSVLPIAVIAAAAAATQAAPPGQLRVNGVPFALQMRVIEGDPATLARRLDGRWGERLAPASGGEPSGAASNGARTPQLSREILGRQRGPFHETLTLLPGPRAGTTHAVVAVHDLRRRPAPLPKPPLSLPAGARLLNVVQFGDAPGSSALFSLESDRSPAQAIARLAGVARAAGWQVSQSPQSATPAGATFWARRGASELAVVATPSASGARLQLLETSGRMEQPW